MTKRVLGGFSLLALGLNGVVGVGIFFLPATLAGLAPGRAGVAVLLVTALLLSPVALTFAALAARFDEDGGPVVFARAAFGDAAAFGVGWVTYLSAVTSTAAIMAGLTRYSLGAWLGLGPMAERGCAAAVAVALAAVSALGLSLSARVWSFLTVAKLLPLVGLVGLGLWAGGRGGPEPVGPPPLAGLGAAALAATFAFQGFEIVPLVAGHAQGERSVPRAVVGALLIAALLYALLHGVCLRALPELSSSKAPLAEAAGVYGGAAWGKVLAAGTNVSSLGIAFGMVTMTPRYLAALGADLGEGLGRESEQGVPLRSLAVTAALVTVLLLTGDLGQLFSLSSVTVLVQYGVTALALLRLGLARRRGLGPADIWPAPLALVAAVVLAWGASRREWLVAAAAMALGLSARTLRVFLAAQPKRSGRA